MANGGPSHRVVTPDDQSALILIIALFLLVASILAVFGRVAIRYGMTKSVTRDDWAAALATLLGLAQTVAIAVATESGLGKVEHRLSSAHISRVIKVSARFMESRVRWRADPQTHRLCTPPTTST